MEIKPKDKLLYEQGKLSLSSIRAAYESKDERLAEYIVKLAIIDPIYDAPLSEEERKAKAEEPEAKWNYDSMRKEYHVDAKNPTVLQGVEPMELLFSGREHQINRAKKAQLAKDRMALLTKNGELVPPRLQLDEIILALWNDGSNYAHSQLLEIIQHVPLKWGPWRAIKKIFKQSFLLQDWNIYIPVASRIYGENATIYTNRFSRSQWQISRELLPTNMDSANWSSSWYWSSRKRANDLTTETKIFINKQISYHLEEMAENFEEEFLLIATELLIRSGSRSLLASKIIDMVGDGWKKSATPLLQIFSETESEDIALWALNLLIENFRQDLAKLPSSWIVKKATSPKSSSKLKRFVFQWFAEPITTIPQSAFIEKGLHFAIIAFLDYGSSLESWQDNNWLRAWNKNPENKTWTALARDFSATFIRSYMNQLTDALNLDKVLWLLRNNDNNLHELGKYLLFPEKGDSPYKDQLDLAFWTNMLGDSRLHDFSQKYMEKNFTGNDLHMEWYRERFQQKNSRVETMVVEWLKDPTRSRKEDDFFDVYFELFVEEDTSELLRKWAKNKLCSADDQGKSLQDRFDGQTYRNLLLSPISDCYDVAISAFENGKVSYETYSIAFMKHLCTDQEFGKNGWKSFVTAEKTISYLVSQVKDLAIQAIYNHPDLPLDELGTDWILERVESPDSNYNFVRTVFLQKFPIAALQENSRTKSAEWVLKIIFDDWNADSKRVRFWKDFIFQRMPLAREYKDATSRKLAPELQFPEDVFTFAWFKKIANHESHYHRTFAFNIASYKMARWIEEEKVGFLDLQGLLFSAFGDVQQFMLDSMSNPKFPEGKIDILTPSFTAEDLYTFCFDGRDEVRTMGIQIIERFPFKFGQPSKLMILSNSADAKVRETVIRVMWKQCEIRTETPNWMPFEGSVLPQSTSGKSSVRAMRSAPPIGVRFVDAPSNVKYLGTGSSQGGELAVESFEEIKDFIERTLFRLPAGRRSPKLPKITFQGKQTWKNKRTLVKSVRDLAIQDEAFAEHIVPILKEFQLAKGKIIRDACISALAQIEIAHNIDIFGGEQ